MLLMTSLFEGRTDGFLHTRVAALLPAKVLKETMRRVYADFHERHAGDYCEEAFKMEFGTGSGQRGPKSGVMLDSGFAIYILFRQVRLQLPQRVRHCVASTLSKRTGVAPRCTACARHADNGAVQWLRRCCAAIRGGVQGARGARERRCTGSAEAAAIRGACDPPLAHDDCR